MPTPPSRTAGPRCGRPLLLTLSLDLDAQLHFDALRRQHFPAHRNHVQAHVTLFHVLPPAAYDLLLADLREACRRNPFRMDVSGVRFLGRGVAYTLHSPDLAALRSDLASRWDGWLVPQDRQPFAPHITVQNKVDPHEARALHERLRAEHQPFPVQACGLSLWRYDGGPWSSLLVEPFHA